MANTIKRGIKKLLDPSGQRSKNRKYKKLLRRIDKSRKKAVELDDVDFELIKYVLTNEYTMVSSERLINTIKSCRYVVENNIPGDFVECGVWRGGNGILAKKIFERLGADKKVWMFDTFAGMTAPTSVDINSRNNASAETAFNERQKETHNE